MVYLSFNYTHYDKKYGDVYKSIEALDKMGMDIIETGDPNAFKRYLIEYDNTICGRHPISVFLHVRPQIIMTLLECLNKLVDLTAVCISKSLIDCCKNPGHCFHIELSMSEMCL